MLDLSEIPEHQRSEEARIFHALRQTATLKVSVPEALRRKVDEALGTFFSDASELIDDTRKFYRARIHEYDQITPFSKEKMGPPPEGLASLGRVQLAGQPMLYTATKAETAIAEIRPHQESHVSIAEFSVKPGCSLWVLNLTKYENPVLDEGPDAFMRHISHLVKVMHFSEREFSRQMHPDDPVRYLDTIYITQLVREQRFDGIAYRSLLHKGGVNFAFFNPGCLMCVTDPVVWKVQSVEYKCEPAMLEDRLRCFTTDLQAGGHSKE